MALDTPQEPRETTSGSDVRERDERSGIRNPRVEYKKQLEEEARERSKERARRRVMDPSGTKIPAQQTPPRVVPGSARVERKDELPPGEIPEGTRPTVSEEFRRQQYGNRYTQADATQKEKQKQAEARAALAETGREAKRRGRRIRNIVQKKQTDRGMGRRLMRMTRVSRATWIAAAACVPLFGYQLFWTIIFLFGAGIEGGAVSIVDILGVGNAVTRFIESIISHLLPGYAFLGVGWVMVIVLGVLQMTITAVIYLIHAINPIRSADALTRFFLVLALQFMPIALLPWVVIWMHAVCEQEWKR